MLQTEKAGEREFAGLSLFDRLDSERLTNRPAQSNISGRVPDLNRMVGFSS
jgi:hypothetical protein